MAERRVMLRWMRLAGLPFVLWLLVGMTAGQAALIAPLGSSPFATVHASTESATTSRDPHAGNTLASIGNGYDALLLRVHLIRAATRSFSIQMFIWTNDECGRLMIYELVVAARRGVKVRVLVDHMFSDQDRDTVALLATVHPNFELKHYRPALETRTSSAPRPVRS